MTTIQEIMQVGVGMPDLAKFESFTQDMLGLPASRSPAGNVTYVRPDQYHHRIAARAAPQPVLDYIGFDVGGARKLAEWETKLASLNIDWRRGTQEERAERQVSDFIELLDPDGHALALCHGFEIDKAPVHYRRDLRVLRLGHALLTVKDTQRSHNFYTSVLGFRLSDWVCIDDNIRLCFLRCNTRHHSLAFAPCMPGKSPRLQHVMFEWNRSTMSCARIISCACAGRRSVWDPAGTSTVKPFMFMRRRRADLPWSLAGASAGSMPCISRWSIRPVVRSTSGEAISRVRSSSLDSIGSAQAASPKDVSRLQSNSLNRPDTSRKPLGAIEDPRVAKRVPLSV